jgi:hypothetical protein
MSNCAKCRSTDLVRVEMTLNGGPVMFCHCRACEHRQWHSADNGNSLHLPEVLDKVAS